AQSQHGYRRGHVTHGWTPGPAPLGHLHSRAAETARRRPVEPVRRHLLGAGDTDPAGEGGCHHEAIRRYGACPHASGGKMMSARTSLAVGAIVALACAAGLAQQRFKAGVELVSLNVTVTDGARYVADLEQADFEVFEDGVKQDITFFTKVQQPIALAIPLDTSA